VVAACAFGVGEMLTSGFFLAPFAAGALLAAVADVAGAGEVVPWIVFIVASVMSLGVLRPIAIRHLHVPAQLRTGMPHWSQGGDRRRADLQQRRCRMREDRRRGMDCACVRR